MRKSSSNWLGVTISAAGTACSRMNSGMPGARTCRARHRRSPDRSNSAPGLARLHPRHRIENGRADIGRAHIAREHAVAFAEHAALARCPASLRGSCAASKTRPCQRRSRCGWRTARCGSARPRRRSAAAETRRRHCRHGHRRRATGSRGYSCALNTSSVRADRETNSGAGSLPAAFILGMSSIDPASFPSCRPRRQICWCRSSTGRYWPWPHPATTG